MRAYFSASPHFGVLVPWWMALPIIMLWGAAAMAFWMCYLVVFMVQSIGLGVRAGWRHWHPVA